MKENIIKGLKILAIALASLAGVFILLTIINIVFPSVSFFGYRFIAKNYNAEEVVVSSDFVYDTYNLNISTGKYEVEIVADENIDGWMSYSYSGFHLGVSDAENVKVLTSVNENTLNLTVLEPLGWVASVNCKITIKLFADYSYNLSVSTHSANTTIKDIDINNANFISHSGNFTVLHHLKEANLQALNVITSSGNLDFSALDLLTIDKKSFIYADNSKVSFNNLHASLFIRASEIDIVAKNIDSSVHGFELVCSKGSFRAQSIISGDKDITVVSDGCLVSINDITGRSNITTTSGNVNIINLNSPDCIIRTTSGNVNIASAVDNIFIITTSGNINVKEYYRTGQFATNSGNVTVKSVSALNVNYSTSISTSSGSVNFENNINKSVVSMGGGQANIKIWNVAQTGNIDHRINNINGKTNIAVMARMADIIRFSLVGDISGSIRELELYADDSFIIRPSGANYTEQATFYCVGGQLVFSQLDPQ